MRSRIVALIACSALFSGCGEESAAHYRTYADLVAAGPAAISWLPSWTPHDAFDIREVHNIDTNHTIGSFRYHHPPSFLSSCRAARFKANPGDAREWPSDHEFAQLRHFDCDERLEYGDGHHDLRTMGVALDAKKRRLFFWRPADVL